MNKHYLKLTLTNILNTIFTDLKQLEISIIGEALKAEATLVLAMFGICQLKRLEVLRLSNITVIETLLYY